MYSDSHSVGRHVLMTVHESQCAVQPPKTIDNNNITIPGPRAGAGYICVLLLFILWRLNKTQSIQSINQKRRHLFADVSKSLNIILLLYAMLIDVNINDYIMSFHLPS